MREPQGLTKRKVESLDIPPTDEGGYSERLRKGSDVLHDSELITSQESIDSSMNLDSCFTRRLSLEQCFFSFGTKNS